MKVAVLTYYKLEVFLLLLIFYKIQLWNVCSILLVAAQSAIFRPLCVLTQAEGILIIIMCIFIFLHCICHHSLWTCVRAVIGIYQLFAVFLKAHQFIWLLCLAIDSFPKCNPYMLTWKSLYPTICKRKPELLNGFIGNPIDVDFSQIRNSANYFNAKIDVLFKSISLCLKMYS